MEAIAFVWAANRVRWQLSSSQTAIADSKREKMQGVYAPVKEAAKERQQQGRSKGGKTAGRGRPKSDSSRNKCRKAKPQQRIVLPRRLALSGPKPPAPIPNTSTSLTS